MKPINSNLILFLICLAIIFTAFLMAVAIDILEVNAMSYDSISLNLEEGERFSGCSVGGSCHESLNELYYSRGGQLYYTRYPEDSKERMNAYFNQVSKEFR
jgi:hypothetical protein